jgi:hypothetical protein
MPQVAAALGAGDVGSVVVLGSEPEVQVNVARNETAARERTAHPSLGRIMAEHASNRVPAARALRSGNARVAELADAPDLGSGGREAVGVRVSPLAPL